MYSAGNLGGGGEYVRRFRISASVIAGQMVVKSPLTGNAEITDAAVNDQTEAVGISLEAGTYSTTQGTGEDSAEVMVKCTYSPNQLVRGKVSGGTGNDTDFDGTANNVIMTEPTGEAAGITLADTDVATSEFVGGYLIGLTGNNAGAVRVIDAHTDNTSTAVVVPFDSDIAQNDTYLRTYGVLNGPGVEITTTFDQYVGVLGAGVDLPDTGDLMVWDVLVDESSTSQGGVVVQNPSQPLVELVTFFQDHVFSSTAL